MSKYITVKCPNCGQAATFDYEGIVEADALILIGEDARCCRRCGTLFVERPPDEDDEDEEATEDEDERTA